MTPKTVIIDRRNVVYHLSDGREIKSHRCRTPRFPKINDGFMYPHDTLEETWCIPLGYGKFAIIEEIDVEMCANYCWSNHSMGYAQTNILENDRKDSKVLHRMIFPNYAHIDHTNRDKLDNRRSNLRNCDFPRNSRNKQKANMSCSSRFKGVSWSKQCKKWVAYCQVSKKLYNLGRFKNEEDAARAYNDKAAELHGEYACLNPI